MNAKFNSLLSWKHNDYSWLGMKKLGFYTTPLRYTKTVELTAPVMETTI
ncbi:hypothetical protein L798_14324 [Zootermopsis nevadensis]|uniref:Uncharacterized protein n=1 Tax=Zootermopsis nevadensis TaxID=136037 RepID=A0A067QMH8_ZOONE|nr:hypothetical protein L798_14324 [Zootermopsis nevadensis]